MVKHKNEHIIYIKDLLFAILYRWRAILIVTLVLAMALGGYRYITLRSNDPNDAKMQEAQETQADYEHQKQLLALEISRLEDRIDTLGNYVANSPFMALNPHKVYINELHFYLESLQSTTVTVEGISDPADALLGAYRTMLLSNETLSSIATALGAEGMNMENIVDVTCDTSANLLTVIVRQADQENTEMVMEVMQQAIDNAHTSISDVMGTHKVSVLGKSVSLRNDTELALVQSQKNEELVNLKKNLETRTAEQNALVPPTTQPVTKQEILVPVTKSALLGAVLGAILMILTAALAHLTRTRVYSRRTLEDMTELCVLGCLSGTRKYSCLDRWLRRLEGRCGNDKASQSALIAARVRNLCGENGILLLTGAGDADARLPLLDALKEAGCTVAASGDLLNCADTVRALGGCTAVILVEQCGKSRYDSVLEAMQQSAVMGKPILGCVLIDG